MTCYRLSKTSVLGVCMTIIVGQDFAEDWRYIGPDSSGPDNHIDKDSMTQSAELVEFWNMVDASSDATVKYRTQKTLVRINCQTKRLGTIYGVTYMPDGSNHDFGPFDYPTMSPIVPGSMGEAMKEFVCD